MTNRIYDNNIYMLYNVKTLEEQQEWKTSTTTAGVRGLFDASSGNANTNQSESLSKQQQTITREISRNPKPPVLSHMQVNQMIINDKLHNIYQKFLREHRHLTGFQHTALDLCKTEEEFIKTSSRYRNDFCNLISQHINEYMSALVNNLEQMNNERYRIFQAAQKRKFNCDCRIHNIQNEEVKQTGQKYKTEQENFSNIEKQIQYQSSIQPEQVKILQNLKQNLDLSIKLLELTCEQEQNALSIRHLVEKMDNYLDPKSLEIIHQQKTKELGEKHEKIKNDLKCLGEKLRVIIIEFYKHNETIAVSLRQTPHDLPDNLTPKNQWGN